jgi:hypothetical protein
MQIQPHPPEVHHGFVRRRCRNPRCGGKLERETDNPRRAFCCPGCYAAFYRNRCAVCEAELPPGPSNRQVCWRAKCRAERRKFPRTYQYAGTVKRPLKSPIKPGLKTDTKRGRPVRQIAGPELSPRSFALATLPLDPEIAARVRRANEQAGIDTTPLAGNGWPIVEIGHANNPFKPRRTRP